MIIIIINHASSLDRKNVEFLEYGFWNTPHPFFPPTSHLVFAVIELLDFAIFEFNNVSCSKSQASDRVSSVLSLYIEGRSVQPYLGVSHNFEGYRSIFSRLRA